jgi:hypothetical protein
MAKRSRRIGDLSIALITLVWIAGAAGAGYLVTHNGPAPADEPLTAATAPPAPIVPVHQVLHRHGHRLSVVRPT